MFSSNALALMLTVASAPPPLVQEPEFKHREHLALPGRQLKCTYCHQQGYAADVKRPATRLETNRENEDHEGHGVCSDAACHRLDFEMPNSSKLCLSCHTKAGRIQIDPPLAYPPSDKHEYFAEMNHRSHLKKKVAQALTERCFHCHQLGGRSGTSSRPGHARCTPCHAGNVKRPPSLNQHKIPSFDACDVCHKTFKERGTRLIDTRCGMGTRFDHELHSVDRRKGQKMHKVSCERCHKVRRASTLKKIRLIRGRNTMVKACGHCHKEGSRKQDGKRLFTLSSDCLKCHNEACVELGSRHTRTAIPPGHR